jgi:hypothetical protein
MGQLRVGMRAYAVQGLVPGAVMTALDRLIQAPSLSSPGLILSGFTERVPTGTEAGRPYVSFTYDVPAGESRSLSLSLRLAPRPSGAYEIHLVPSPFIHPTTATIDIATGDDRIDTALTLDRTWVVSDDRDPEQTLAPIYQPRKSGKTR